MGKPVIDETGNRYGKLLVLSRAENDRKGQATWLCRCDCGNETTVRGYNLRRGNTKSCGCLRDNGCCLSEGESGFNEMISKNRHNARIRGYTWELTREQVRAITGRDCYYCGALPSQVMGYGHGEYVYSGIDRKDNNLGYVISNCVPCCTRCNYAKHTEPIQEFMAWIVRVYKHSAHDSVEGVEQDV